MLKLLGTATVAALLAMSVASRANAAADTDWWTDLGLTAADVGKAALPWTTHPRPVDEGAP
jgi:hypothetical protein